MTRGLLWLVMAAAITVASFLPYSAGRALFDPHPNLQWLNIYGDYMDNYDMGYMNPDALDWPVDVVWRYEASLDDVRSYLARKGYGPVQGVNKFVRVWEDSQGGGVEWSGSMGNQTECFDGPDPEAASQGCLSGDRCMRHTRTYADNQYFSNDEWGHYIVATVHYDTNHAGCVGSGSEKFGWSETVEWIIVDQAEADGFNVVHNSHDIDMHNAGYGDIDATHYHQSDGYASFIYFFPDADGDGVADDVDNCPTVYNPDQANYDHQRRPNGSQIPGDWASNPAQDNLGDACDPDDDNDRLPDGQEQGYLGCPNRTLVDSDGDRFVDGHEVANGSNPCNAGSKPAPIPNAETDGDEHHGYNTCAYTDDSIPVWSACAVAMDSDGDGCADTLEDMDINGDRRVNVADQTALAKRSAQLPGFEPDPVSDVIYDNNKDGKVSIGDQTLMAKNTCQQKPWFIGCEHGVCPAED